MKHVSRGTLAMLAAAVLLIIFIPAAVIFASASDGDAELNKLRENIGKLSEERKAAEKAYENAKNGLADAVKMKTAIDAEIDALQTEIDALEKLGNEYARRLGEIEEQIGTVKTQLDEKMSLLREQLRCSYEDGSAGYLDVFFSSDGIGDFLVQFERVSALYEYGSRLTEECNSVCAELEKTQAELSALNAEAAGRLALLEESRGKLEVRSNEAEQIMQKYNSDKNTAYTLFKTITDKESEFNEKLEKLLAERMKQSNSRYAGGDMIWPLPNAYTEISSGFGWRIHPITQQRQFHTSIDIPAPYKTEIYAANSGTVAEIGNHSANGKYILIDHGGGIATFYSHLSSINVVSGQKVSRGDVIGLVGMTGLATGYHLNFSVFKDGTAVDPLNYYKR